MINWLNQNAGFVSVLIFITTLILGWVSGIFKSLMRKPKFKIGIIEGPTFASTFTVGKKHKGFDVHKTAISLYLRITNIGNAPANIEKISIAYHWNITKFNMLWIRYRLLWFWLNEQTVIMDDFKYDFGETIKVYPFLIQKSYIDPSPNKDLYLREGQNAIGVTYFEQDESYGGCFPLTKRERTKVKVKVVDSYGNKFYKKFSIRVVKLEEAKKYNPSFGETYRILKEAQEKSQVAS
ncbi:MAG: hypothetical protein PF690_17335 [Deltaproteobacteria bacterium]|jgi:hypothetical protein|nr:hypothetical protein [Deltaproteobacteria bacterium]